MQDVLYGHGLVASTGKS